VAESPDAVKKTVIAPVTHHGMTRGDILNMVDVKPAGDINSTGFVEDPGFREVFIPVIVVDNTVCVLHGVPDIIIGKDMAGSEFQCFHAFPLVKIGMPLVQTP